MLEHASGCCVCAASRRMEARDLQFFMIETHTEAAVVAGIGEAGGLCAAHLRRLIARRESEWVGPSVYAAVLARLDTRLGQDGTTFRRCPFCVRCEHHERELVRRLLSVLRRDAVRRAYARTGGLCLPHLQLAVKLSPSRAAQDLLVQVALEDFAAAASREPAAQLERTLGGDIAAAAGEAALWARSAADGIDERLERGTRALRDWLRDLVAHDVCLVCTVEDAGERQYLSWYLEHRGSATGPADAELALCPRHLSTQWHVDPDAASAVTVERRERWRKRIAELAESMERRPTAGGAALLNRLVEAAGLAESWIRAWRRGGRQSGGVLDAFVADTRCACCTAGAQRGRHLRLLYRALAGDEGLWREIADGGAGLCLRHALPDGRVDTTDPFVRLLRHRLRLWHWDVAEHQRKRGWQARHESHGCERSGWLHACAALDGRAFAGGAPDARRLRCIRDDPDTHNDASNVEDQRKSAERETS